MRIVFAFCANAGNINNLKVSLIVKTMNIFLGALETTTEKSGFALIY